MAWPPSQPTTGFSIAGIAAPAATTIVWGTGGFENNGLANYIVKSMRTSEMVEEINIEQGDGLIAYNILLNNGYEWETTVIDNSAVVPPASGSDVILLIPFVGASGGTDTHTYTARVINNSYNAARKVEGERVLMLKWFRLFSVKT